MPRERIIVAMSGGVDSSVAAAMLCREGYEVIGVFMRLGSPGEVVGLVPGDEAVEACETSPARIGHKLGHRGCCSINDAADARTVADELGVPFYVCNFKDRFGRIIDYFADEYARGRTPNPCVRCNDWLKFGSLHDYARSLGATRVASGHYAWIDHVDGRARLRRGVDEDKDQSYVLFGASAPRLDEMLLPVGRMRKAEVRAEAERLGLPVFDKPDSQEICFVPDDDYAGLVERRRPELRASGSVVTVEGEVLGEHAGQHRFTIGQRRGLGLAMGRPIYVVDRRPETNEVVVGEREDLLADGLIAGEANWHIDQPDAQWRPAWAQHRYNSSASLAEFRALEPSDADTPSGRLGRFEVRFREAREAIAPGQAVVLYDIDQPDLVLGGGWIERAMR